MEKSTANVTMAEPEDVTSVESGVPRTSLAEDIKPYGLLLTEEGYIRWDNQNPTHPRNWGASKKIYNSIIILLLEFVTYVILSALVYRD
jgi:hypothetical protein